jgi:hypothetical protein
MRELNVVICWWFHFTWVNFVTNNMIYYQHVNNPASYVRSLILWLKKFNWICSGNLCSHLWMANHCVKVVHEASIRRFRIIQYKKVICFSWLPLFLLDKYCCRWLPFCITNSRNYNFRQIIHTDWDTPTRFLSSCNNMICWWGRRNIIVAHSCRNIIEWKFFTLWFSLVEVGVELKMLLLNYWNIAEDDLWMVSYDHIGDVGIEIWLIEWVWLIELLN